MTEKEGVEAIIALQKIVGITETPEKAHTRWNEFSEDEKKETLYVFRLMCGGRVN